MPQQLVDLCPGSTIAAANQQSTIRNQQSKILLTASPPASPAPTRRAEFLAGVRATIPLVVGAIPFGIIFGAVAIAPAGKLSPLAAGAMSAFVFAGSSQFIAAGLVASGTGLLVLILTTFIINLRHGLYSATLAPYMKHLPRRWLLPLGFWLTDETFVVAVRRYYERDDAPHKHWFMLGSSLFMYLNWQACTWVGILAGSQIEDASRWGLDYAMSVTFLGMVVPMVTSRPVALAVGVAATTAVLAGPLPYNLGLMLAALLGVAAGVLAERRWPEKSSPPAPPAPAGEEQPGTERE